MTLPPTARRQVDARLGIDITLLLVGVAFKQDMATATPNISYLTMLDSYTVVGLTFLVALVACHATIGFVMFDCDTLSGDCTFGVYWPWYRHGVRDIHGKVGLDGNMPAQDDHMQIGYTIDFALATIYICCWVAYNLYWWRSVLAAVADNRKMLQDDDGAFWIQKVQDYYINHLITSTLGFESSTISDLSSD